MAVIFPPETGSNHYTLSCHILAIEAILKGDASPREVEVSRTILEELLVGTEIYAAAVGQGRVATASLGLCLYVLFPQDPLSPALCAVEIWKTLQDLPSLSIRMAVHSGEIDVRAHSEQPAHIIGGGIDIVNRLLRAAGPSQIVLSDDYAASYGALADLPGRIVSSNHQIRLDPQKLVILESPASSEQANSEQESVGDLLTTALTDDGYEAIHHTQSTQGVAWAQSVEAHIRSADAIVALVSPDHAENDLFRYQLEIAADERRKRGKPQIVPVWLDQGPTPDDPQGVLTRNRYHTFWQGRIDNAQIVENVRAALARGQIETDTEVLETTGGAVTVGSPFYVQRLADSQFEKALLRHESIVLVKGPRQIGKTSLIARGAAFVQDQGWRCAMTDFQMLSSRQMESETSFYRVLATTLARQLGFAYDFESEWIEDLGTNPNMDSFIRSLLDHSDIPLVWFVDEADRLFTSRFASDFFGLIRSWHNARATDRRGQWGRFTVVIGYATEAHLFIRDLNQSPFNVGYRLDLLPFSLENLQDLNRRYGSPLSSNQLGVLSELLGGQPYLSRRAFELVANGQKTFDSLVRDADKENGPFADHLKRVLVSITQLPEVWTALVQSLTNPNLPDTEGLQRLVAAGVLVRTEDGRYELPCELYRRFLARYVQRGGAK